LRELELGRACRWTVDPPTLDETKRRAYEIREALYIASLYPSEFPALAQARKNFSLFIIKPGVIEAKPRGTSSLAPALLKDRETPIHGIGPWGREVATVGLTTSAEVQRAWLDHEPSLDPIHCQQTTLPLVELKDLHVWATLHTPRLMLLVGEGFITVSLRDTEMDGYAWKPPEPEPEPEKNYDL
jgi:hypothetical protein